MKTLQQHAVTRLLAVFLSITLVAPYALAGEVGKITYTEGRVERLSPDSGAAMPLSENDSVSVGDSIRTKSNAKAEITFNDKTVVRVAQNSKVDIKDYQLDAENKRKTATIEIERGKARSIIAKMPDKADFIITTPNARGTVRGSDVIAFYQAGNSGMLVNEGKLNIMSLSHPESSLDITPGNSVVVPLEDLPKGPRPYLEIEKKLHEQDTNIPVTIRKEKSSVIKAVIAKMSGDVKVTKKGSISASAASVNDILGDGDKIETGTDGIVELKFDNGNALNMKPGSNLTITKLAMDLSTGEYENLFESTAGKIRARIEGLKGKSRFEIKTPTAVSGARGTIMYLEITPTTMRVFFEGGNGSLNNIISGLQKAVAAGENAYADNGGNISDPQPTSDVDRETFGEGWDPGTGTEGYSAPERTAGMYVSGDETGGARIVGGVIEPPVAGGMGPLNDVQFNQVFGGSQNPPVPVPVEDVTSGADLSAATAHYGTVNGFIEGTGLARIVDTFWNGQTATLISAGNYGSDDGAEPFLWGSVAYSRDPVTGALLTYDGGAFLAIVGGIGGSGIMEGLLQGIYIDPAGNAGIVQGDDMAGSYSRDEGVSLLGGTLMGSQMPEEENIGVAAVDFFPSLWVNEDVEELADYVYQIWPDEGGDTLLRTSNGNSDSASIDDDAVMLSGLFGEFGGSMTTIGEEGMGRMATFSLVNRDLDMPEAQDWGIFLSGFLGSYAGPVAAGWTGAIGGRVNFGAYYNDALAQFKDDEGYWLADLVSGTWNGDHSLGAQIANGTFISYAKIGTVSGGLLGTYDDNGTWQAIGLGTWDGEPLEFFSAVSADRYSMDTEETKRYEGERSWHEHVGRGKQGRTISYDYAYYYYKNGMSGFRRTTKTTDGSLDSITERYYFGDGDYKEGKYREHHSHGQNRWGWEYDTGDWNVRHGLDFLKNCDSDPMHIHYQYLTISEEDGFLSGYLGSPDPLVWGGMSHITFIGEYDPTEDFDDIWQAQINSYNYKNDSNTTYGGGAYYGYLIGSPSEALQSLMIAIYVDRDGKGGYILGGLDGETSTDINMFKIEGDVDVTQLVENSGIDPKGLLHRCVKHGDTRSLLMCGSGNFEGEGAIQALALGRSLTLETAGREWGIWYLMSRGDYSTLPKTDTSWDCALGGFSDEGAYHVLGTMRGESWSDGYITDAFRGIFLSNDTGRKGTLKAGKVTGDAYIDIDEKSGTWDAFVAGEWVEVTELLDPAKIGFDMVDLDRFVSIPVTEAYAGILTGSNSFINQATMDISLYQNTNLERIWAALIQGPYSSVPATNWSLTFGQEENNSVILTGPGWQDGNWLADVSGKVGGNTITTGQAGGTYTPPDANGAGTFTGVGAGTWTPAT